MNYNYFLIYKIYNVSNGGANPSSHPPPWIYVAAVKLRLKFNIQLKFYKYKFEYLFLTLNRYIDY